MLNTINLNENYQNSFEKFTMTFQCSHCTRNFSHHASLRNHIKTHENVIENYLQEIAEKDCHKTLSKLQCLEFLS